MQSRAMNYKVRAWLFLFRLRDRYRRLRAWYYGHKPTWLIILELRFRRWKLG